MQKPTSDTKYLSERRNFLKSAGAVAAGLYLAGTSRLAKGRESVTSSVKTETLAINGGQPAVSYPSAKKDAILKWPNYGDAEKTALKDAIDDPGKYYSHGPELEKKWREFNGVPFAKTHMNGTSAITSMFFALDLPPGSEMSR